MRHVFYGVRPPSLSLRGAKRRGNLGKAVTISPMAFPRFGRVLRDCHGPLRGLAMTSLGALHICRKYLQICSCQRRSLTAATDAIGAYRFHGGLYKSAVPPRDCHVASLLAMTNLEALTAHIASLHGGHCPMDKSDIPGFARSDIFLSESDIKASRLL